jgi:aspartyl/asparaginyl-tRNA synthetase
MQRTLSRDLAAHVGERVWIAGWIHRRRLLKSVAFLIIRDATGLAQVVITDPSRNSWLDELTEESVVAFCGMVVANEAAPAGVELNLVSVEVPPRHAATRRVRDRAGTVPHAAASCRQHRRGDPFPSRPHPPHPVTP